MTFKVELVQREDAKDMLNYLKEVGSETDFLLFGSEGVGLSIEEEMKVIDSFSKTPFKKMYIVKDNLKIIATAHIQLHTKDRTKHKSSIGISVLKAYWNQGVGSMLIKTLIDYAKSTGITETIYLEVLSNNHKAIGLYEKFGFYTYAMDKRSTKIDNEYFDNNLMRLDF